MSLTVHFSNRLEKLRVRLAERLFANDSGPFTRRLLICPSEAIRSWLTLGLASDCGILAGVEFLTVAQALQRMAPKINWPTLQDLTLRLAADLDEEKKPLALRLARLFQQYGLYGAVVNASSSGGFASLEKSDPLADSAWLSASSAELPSGDKFSLNLKHLPFSAQPLCGRAVAWDGDDWQQRLWQGLFDVWPYPARDLGAPVAPDEESQFHLFGFSHLPPLHHRFFAAAAAHSPVHYYLLSPCPLFWTDTRSRREAHALLDFHEKRGSSEAQRESLEAHLSDTHPLLANWGRLGRKFAALLEEDDLTSEEIYVLPASVRSLPHYDSLLHDEWGHFEPSGKLTLLQALQADIALLRPPQNAPLNLEDDSIQVHASLSLLREVELLHDLLLNFLESDLSLTPRDILVMAPDITSYRAALQAVFERDERHLPYQILDLKLSEESPLARGFLHLLKLSRSRFEATAVLQLFDGEAFRRRHGISREDLDQLRRWILNTGIRWGGDSAHQRELLLRETGREGRGAPSATWESGLEKLLMGFCMVDPYSSKLPKPGPLGPGSSLPNLGGMETPLKCIPRPLGRGSFQMDVGEADLAGTIWSLLRALRHDLQALVDGTQLTPHEWAAYFQTLLEGYFRADSDCSEDAAALVCLSEELGAISRAQSSDCVCTAECVIELLEEALQARRTSRYEHCANAIRFCSLLPVRAIPAEIVVLLGMEESRFPRLSLPDPLDRLEACSHKNYRPSTTDYDRYLFLEAVLSARKKLVLSFVGSMQTKNNDRMPSLLISELLEELDSRFLVGNRLPSQAIVQTHQRFGFHSSYFEPGAHLHSFSRRHYLAARAYYGERKPLIEFLMEPKPPSGSMKERIYDLRELLGCAKNPLQYFCNKALGVYFSGRERTFIEDAEEWLMSRPALALLSRKALRKKLDELLREVPQGPLSDLSRDRLIRKTDELHGGLEACSVVVEQLFSARLHPSCAQPTQTTTGDWLLPPLKIGGAQIVGRLENLSPQGWIAFGREGIVSGWPAFLVAVCLQPIAMVPQVVVPEKNRLFQPILEDAPSLLAHFLGYMEAAATQPSPLLPEWILHFIEKDAEALSTQMENSLASDRFYNDYARWLFPRELPARALIDAWAPSAQQIFSPLQEYL